MLLDVSKTNNGKVKPSVNENVNTYPASLHPVDNLDVINSEAKGKWSIGELNNFANDVQLNSFTTSRGGDPAQPLSMSSCVPRSLSVTLTKL